MSKGDKSKAVVGLFGFLDDAVRALGEAKAREWEFRAYSPCPVEAFEAYSSFKKSNIRLFTLAGGLTGLTCGFTLTILCSLDYPLRTSAKPIVSLPAYVPIGFECTVLFAALATFAALFLFGRLPYLFRKIGYDPRFSKDKFGVVVTCGPDEVEIVSEVFARLGAEEVNVEDAL